MVDDRRLQVLLGVGVLQPQEVEDGGILEDVRLGQRPLAGDRHGQGGGEVAGPAGEADPLEELPRLSEARSARSALSTPRRAARPAAVRASRTMASASRSTRSSPAVASGASRSAARFRPEIEDSRGAGAPIRAATASRSVVTRGDADRPGAVGDRPSGFRAETGLTVSAP